MKVQSEYETKLTFCYHRREGGYRCKDVLTEPTNQTESILRDIRVVWSTAYQSIQPGNSTEMPAEEVPRIANFRKQFTIN